MNKVMLTGVHLGKDPDVKYSGETTIARFSVASKRKGKNDETDWINIVCFNSTAQFAEKYLHKGSRINLIGRIQTGSYTNKNGDKVYTTDVIAEELEFGESKKVSQCNTEPQEKPVENPIDDEEGFMNVTEDDLDGLPFS